MAGIGSISHGNRLSRRPSGRRARLWNRVRVSVASDCVAPRSRWIFATVVVIELAQLIWAERIDERSHGSHALLRRQRRLGRADPAIVLTRNNIWETENDLAPDRRRIHARQGRDCSLSEGGYVKRKAVRVRQTVENPFASPISKDRLTECERMSLFMVAPCSIEIRRTLPISTGRSLSVP
jgi:hypothetical protein